MDVCSILQDKELLEEKQTGGRERMSSLWVMMNWSLLMDGSSKKSIWQEYQPRIYREGRVREKCLGILALVVAVLVELQDYSDYSLKHLYIVRECQHKEMG